DYYCSSYGGSENLLF
nr:immunoglobulin light chain junction region [Macaca mulatta]MOW60747.1 immunoglobulin light chain junction region [Macaca mulatta]